MSGHHEAKPYQPRRGPAPADEEAAPAAAADEAEAEAEVEAMERYEQEQEYEEGEEGEEEEYEGGEGVPMDADASAAAVAGMDPHGEMVPVAGGEAGGGYPHVASNTLTLSFQGEVYVFESVSAERVLCLRHSSMISVFFCVCFAHLNCSVNR